LISPLRLRGRGQRQWHWNGAAYTPANGRARVAIFDLQREPPGADFLLAPDLESSVTRAALFVDAGQLASKFGMWLTQRVEFSNLRRRQREVRALPACHRLQSQISIRNSFSARRNNQTTYRPATPL